MIVSDSIAVTFGLRMIDASGNRQKWEHSASLQLWENFKNSRVPLVGELALPMTVQEVHNELARPDDFSTLLFVTHGNSGNPTQAAQVLLGDHIGSIFELGQSNAQLDDRAVLLAICGAANQDSEFALGTDIQLAHVLVAPEGTLSKTEYLAFFSAFMPEFAENSQSGLNNSYIRTLVSEKNHLAGNKMRVFPSQ